MYLEVVLTIPIRIKSTSKVIQSLFEDYTSTLHSFEFISTDALLSIGRRKSSKFSVQVRTRQYLAHSAICMILFKLWHFLIFRIMNYVSGLLCTQRTVNTSYFKLVQKLNTRVLEFCKHLLKLIESRIISVVKRTYLSAPVI